MVRRGRFSAWGGVSATPAQTLRPGSDDLRQTPAAPYLACGAGRSYGDTCLPPDAATLIDTSRLNQVIAFDAATGVVRAGAGMRLCDLLAIIVPQGWFAPVSPGTAHVTLGGALANDVHGKNHHVAGAFGRFVRAFELRRSDRPPMICSRDRHADYFAATIGGMGLTGLVAWVELELIRINSGNIAQRITRFRDLDACFALGPAFEAATYSVAWLDGLADGRALGRGLLIDGEHADDGDLAWPQSRTLNIPFTPPINLVWRAPVRAMNALYLKQREGDSMVGAAKFFYPLDGVGNWARLYGPRGFHQFQCVIPDGAAYDAVRKLLATALAEAGGSNLVVLKKFGDLPSPGLLSFPMPGYTLTMDFADRGDATRATIGRLERIALDAGGRINPYKTRAMSAETFRASCPRWRDMLAWLDPCAESQFSRRVGLMSSDAAGAMASCGRRMSPLS